MKQTRDKLMKDNKGEETANEDMASTDFGAGIQVQRRRNGDKSDTK